ncbi:MAG: hypothetical protein MHM6MM_001273 [Cercozoa sp. M6MM]
MTRVGGSQYDEVEPSGMACCAAPGHGVHVAGAMPVGIRPRSSSLVSVHGLDEVAVEAQVEDTEGDVVTVKDEAGEARLGVFGAAVNFMNIIVGSGIIGLPFVLHQMGLGLGMCMLVFVAVVCDYTSQLLVRSALRVGKRDFEELAEHLWNRSGFYAASVFPLIVNFGALCAYTVILTDTLPVVVKAVLPDDVPAIVTSEWFIPLCALVVVVGPLCTLRDLSALSAVSFMSTLSMCCIVIGVIVRGAAVSNGFKFDPERIVNNEFPPYEFARSDVGTIVQGFGTISFAFAIHDTTFCVYPVA